MLSKIISAISGPPNRIAAVRRFAVTITIVTLLGHLYIGFETSYACTVVSVVSACIVQFLLEWMRAKIEGVKPVYADRNFLDFMLPAYIVGMTCGMFLFTNGRLLPMVFASTLAIASKFLFRVSLGEKTIHFLNPSNFAIVVILLVSPSVAMVMPFSFSAGFGDVGDFVFPIVLFGLGCLVNGIFTKRLILIAFWLLGFVAQGLVRYWFFDAQLPAILAVATGPIAVLFSFYMISDPGTTPSSPREQALFGLSIATIYGILTVNHVIYGIFIALMLTCLTRGLLMMVSEYRARNQVELAVQ